MKIGKMVIGAAVLGALGLTLSACSSSPYGSSRNYYGYGYPPTTYRSAPVIVAPRTYVVPRNDGWRRDYRYDRRGRGWR